MEPRRSTRSRAQDKAAVENDGNAESNGDLDQKVDEAVQELVRVVVSNKQDILRQWALVVKFRLLKSKKGNAKGKTRRVPFAIWAYQHIPLDVITAVVMAIFKDPSASDRYRMSAKAAKLGVNKPLHLFLFFGEAASSRTFLDALGATLTRISAAVATGSSSARANTSTPDFDPDSVFWSEVYPMLLAKHKEHHDVAASHVPVFACSPSPNRSGPSNTGHQLKAMQLRAAVSELYSDKVEEDLGDGGQDRNQEDKESEQEQRHERENGATSPLVHNAPPESIMSSPERGRLQSPAVASRSPSLPPYPSPAGGAHIYSDEPGNDGQNDDRDFPTSPGTRVSSRASRSGSDEVGDFAFDNGGEPMRAPVPYSTQHNDTSPHNRRTRDSLSSSDDQPTETPPTKRQKLEPASAHIEEATKADPIEQVTVSSAAQHQKYQAPQPKPDHMKAATNGNGQTIPVSAVEEETVFSTGQKQQGCQPAVDDSSGINLNVNQKSKDLAPQADHDPHPDLPSQLQLQRNRQQIVGSVNSFRGSHDNDPWRANLGHNEWHRLQSNNGEKAWLNDSIVQSLADIIVASHTHQGYYHLAHHELQQVQTDDELRAQHAIRYAGAKHIFVTINSKNVHWLLGHVDIEARRLLIYNSLLDAQDSTEKGRAVLRQLADHLPPNQDQNFEWKSSEVVPVLQQQDEFSCGVYMIANLVHLVTGRPLPTSSLDTGLWCFIFTALLFPNQGTAWSDHPPVMSSMSYAPRLQDVC